MIDIPKLFVLDDDEQYAELLVELATNIGWKAVSEQSASYFLSNLPLNGILVLDLIMPEMDGIEVIRELAKLKANLPLILISGFDSRVLHSAKQLAEAHKIKVLASFTKPVAIHEFINVLEKNRAKQPELKKTSSAANEITALDLKNAIINNQLVLYYQPQLDMKTNELLGVEALVRWQHPERGLIFPDQFIDLAEKENLISLLTEKVITMAIKQSQQWKLEGLDILISINVSAQNITSLSLPEQLINLTEQYGISPSNIILEVTETAVVKELTSSLDVLNRLRMKGFSLSIDDFGTGYSSLTQLYQAPFSEIKIDQQFVMRMLDDTEAMVIVKICIMLGHELGMRLVAEGVETKEIWDKLKSLGCDIAQGYFMAKPMHPKDLLSWEKNRVEF